MHAPARPGVGGREAGAPARRSAGAAVTSSHFNRQSGSCRRTHGLAHPPGTGFALGGTACPTAPPAPCLAAASTPCPSRPPPPPPSHPRRSGAGCGTPGSPAEVSGWSGRGRRAAALNPGGGGGDCSRGGTGRCSVGLPLLQRSTAISWEGHLSTAEPREQRRAAFNGPRCPAGDPAGPGASCI